MASVQSLVTSGVAFVPSFGIAGVPCQLARRARGGGGGRSNAQQGGRGPLLRIRGQAPAEDGGESQGGGGGGGDDDFEARLARIQRKSASGTGKKAEIRKARKALEDPSSSSAAAARPDGIFIEPVPLKEAVSGGVNVELGLTPYTERLHGRLAALGVAAVLLVELATGDSLVKFHDTGTLSLQVYAIFGVAAVFVKYEKERRSVWPKS